MGKLLRNAEHLVRLALIFAVGLALVLVVRALLVPDDFGELGHFRTRAIADNRLRTPAFAGRAACGDCHADAVAALAAGGHGAIGCESCHGALAGHVESQGEIAPRALDAVQLCSLCHAANVARPPIQPQVDVAAHAEGAACTDCHEAHAPAP
jgi:hypothetical protein